jgi:hypothetical protein
MRKAITILGMALVLAGCMQGPQSTDEVRSVASRGAMFGKQTTLMVKRPYSAVASSFRAGAGKCLNQTKTVSGWGAGPAPGSRVYTSTSTAYRGTVKSGNGRTELAIYQEVLGSGFLPQPKGYSYVVDATPVSGGTRLDIYGGRFGTKDLNDAVVAWAQTGQIRCPKLPG